MKPTTLMAAMLLMCVLAVGAAHADTVYSNASDALNICSSSQDSYYPAGGTSACQDYGTLTITTTTADQTVQFDARTWLRRSSGGTFNGLWRIRDVTNAAVIGAEQTIINPTSPGVNGTYSTNISVATPGTYTYRLQYHTVGTFNAMILDGFNLTITVVTPPAPTAAFSLSASSGYHPLTVNFTDTSTGTPTSWAWDFDNDGIVDSTSQNPSHVFSTDGVYTVVLNATNAQGSSVVNHTVTVTSNPSVTAPSLNGGGRVSTAQALVVEKIPPTVGVQPAQETQKSSSDSGSSGVSNSTPLFTKIKSWLAKLFGGK